MTEIIGVDQGTTSTKALLLDESGAVRGATSVGVRRTYPRPGWVEQDPRELWDSVRGAIAQLPRGRAGAIALANQRESVVMWDRRTGQPLTPVVSWQCGRGANLCRELSASGAGDLVRELTGLPLDPMFSATKLRALLDDDPALRAAAEAGTACAGTIDSWLVWQLTAGGQHVTDHGNASRTLLFDIHRGSWSETLLELFDIPLACLPAVVESAAVVGQTALQPDGRSLTIGARMADSHAAAFGLGCIGPGTAKATYGTGTSMLAPSGPRAPRSHHGLAATVAWCQERSMTYALEGNVFSTGATVEWLSGILGLSGAAAVEQLAASGSGSGGVHLVPAFAGIGAPYWRPDARAMISGLTFSTQRAHLAQAAFESIAFQVADLVEALDGDVEAPVGELRVDGGAANSDALMQLQADLLGRSVVRFQTHDAAALGAARMAASTAGNALAPIDPSGPGWAEFTPRLGAEERHEKLRAWRVAVAQTMDQPDVVTV